nr:MAG: RNA replicase beta chain [Hangzhou fiers-like virus 1]
MKHHKSAAKRTFREPTLPLDMTDQLREKLLALPSSVKTDYLKAEVFSKFVSSETDPPETRRQAAIRKWLAAERDNEATSDRLRITDGEYNILPRVGFDRFVDWCRREISRILGDIPPVEALIGTFSGGASTSRSRTYSHPANKYVGKAHVTAAGLRLFEDFVCEEVPGWIIGGSSEPLEIEVVDGNVLFTVPKKTDIDRVACKEPDLNMFMQKGIGLYIRKALRRTGINLNDQSINRSLAHRGSITGDLVTLDLSSASDSVTTELVRLLLPEYWFTFLDSVRSPVTIIDGEEHRNWMFSSMGNGYTFELESLLFLVLVRATAYFRGIPGVVSVYGDDLIMPTGIADYAIFVLGYFGFQVNPDKSCTSGPFRESCGGHYHNGRDITPFYVRKPISSIVDVIHIANSLREWDQRDAPSVMMEWPQRSLHQVHSTEVEEIWLWLKSHIPRCLWGGEDFSFKYQLVSYDEPQKRLHQETRKRVTGLGGYLHWLNATWDRTGLGDEPVVTSSATVHNDSPKLRLRPVRSATVPRLRTLFMHELCDMTVKQTDASPAA